MNEEEGNILSLNIYFFPPKHWRVSRWEESQPCSSPKYTCGLQRIRNGSTTKGGALSCIICFFMAQTYPLIMITYHYPMIMGHCSIAVHLLVHGAHHWQIFLSSCQKAGAASEACTTSRYSKVLIILITFFGAISSVTFLKWAKLYIIFQMPELKCQMSNKAGQEVWSGGSAWRKLSRFSSGLELDGRCWMENTQCERMLIVWKMKESKIVE